MSDEAESGESQAVQNTEPMEIIEISSSSEAEREQELSASECESIKGWNIHGNPARQ